MTLYQKCFFPTPSPSIFPMQENPSEQDLGSLLVCSSFCLCTGRFSTGLNQPEHIQSTCNFLSRKRIASLGYSPPLLQVFSLSCLSPWLRRSREMSSCPVHHVHVGARAIQGKMDWSEQVGKAQSGAENHNNIPQVVRYYFSFVAYWLTVSSEFLVFKTRQLWWSFFKKFISHSKGCRWWGTAVC